MWARVIYLFVWYFVHATFLLEVRRDNGISSTGGAPIIQVRFILLLSKSAGIKGVFVHILTSYICQFWVQITENVVNKSSKDTTLPSNVNWIQFLAKTAPKSLTKTSCLKQGSFFRSFHHPHQEYHPAYYSIILKYYFSTKDMRV